MNDNVPDGIHFSIPFITTEQVMSYIRILDPSKATGLDGLGPKINKLAANSISPFIATLINKSIISGTFPSQLKCAKVYPIFKSGSKTAGYQFCLQSQIIRKTCKQAPNELFKQVQAYT